MNLLKTLAAISSMTMLSRVTGLLRESLFARAFGASAWSDAFIVAFRIPNLLRRLFAEGAFAQAFVPILSEYKTQEGEERTKILVDHVATTLVWSTVLVSVAGIIFSPALILLIATGLEKNTEAVFMTRLMFPYIACMSFVALAGGVLNTWRQFKIPAFTPVLPHLSLNPLSGLRDPGVRRMLQKMGPAVFAVSAAQISLMINTNIASRLAPGSVSALSYADRLMEFPTALLGVALGTILLPSLSKANAEKDHTEYSALLDWGLRLTFMLAMPAAVGMATLAEPLIATLFHYGKFNAADVAASSLPLMAYSAGLLGIILVKTLAPAFYARQDIKTPVRIAIGVLIATQLMNYVFVPRL